MLRESCKDCVLKHIGQAAVLLAETVKDYPEHFVYAMGHLAEAEDESTAMFPDVAKKIREFRINCLTSTTSRTELGQLVDFIYRWWSEDDS